MEIFATSSLFSTGVLRPFFMGTLGALSAAFSKSPYMAPT